jgi:prevent-host-death family protein
MKSMTIREVQHRLAAVLKRVESGEEVEIRRRQRPVARIVPLAHRAAPGPVDWSRQGKEIDRIFGGRLVGGTPSEIIVAEGRGEH